LGKGETTNKATSTSAGFLQRALIPCGGPVRQASTGTRARSL